MPHVQRVQFDWQSYIDVLVDGTNITLTMDDTVYVRNPEYFLGLQSRLTTTDLEEFRNKNLIYKSYHYRCALSKRNSYKTVRAIDLVENRGNFNPAHDYNHANIKKLLRRCHCPFIAETDQVTYLYIFSK